MTFNLSIVCYHLCIWGSMGMSTSVV